MNKLIRYIAIAYAVYLALALLVLTPALNFLPHKYLQDTYQRELQTGLVWFNPFTISLEVRDAQLPELNGERFVGFSEASVNLSLASLWCEDLVLDAIRVRDLYVHVVLLAPDSFNFSDFLASDSTSSNSEPQDTTPLGVTIHDFDIHSEMIMFSDLSREKPFSSNLDGLSVKVAGFSTVVAAGQPYKLDLSSQDGGSLHWEGTVSVRNETSAGKLAITGLKLRPFWQFAEPWVNFELREGQLNAQGSYTVSWHEGFSYEIADGKVALAALDIIPAETVELPDTSVVLAQLELSNITVDSIEQRASAKGLTLDGFDLRGFSDENNVSLQLLFAPVAAETPEPAQQPAPATGDEEPENSWTANLSEFQLRRSSLHWRSAFTDPPLLQIDAIEASAKNLNWPLAGDSPVSLSLGINEHAKLTVQGTVSLETGAGALNYSVTELALPWFDPALPSQLRATLTGGQLQTNGSVELSEYAPVNVSLEATLSAFELRQDDVDDALAGWNSLRLEGLTVDMQGRSLVLEKLALDGLATRLFIAADGSVNVANLWQAEETESVAPSEDAPSDDAPTEAPWSMSIPTVVISNGAVDITDKSVANEFHTVIDALEGEILGLDSTAAAPAKIDLKGAINGTAPIRLSGSFKPLSTPMALDLKLSADGFDLDGVTPYTATYLGYPIQQGLLTMDLSYTIEDVRLVGRNSIQIKQLKLGKKVKSKQAVNLPLELALSLLRDSDGLIDLQVPVAGNTADPEFAVGKVIGGAFLNLITKAVTSPFSLLGKLVGSDADLQHLEFGAGSATLDSANKEKLAALASALEQRPALSLVITPRLRPDVEREGMQAAVLEAQLLKTGLSAQNIKLRNEQWQDAIAKQFRTLAQPAENWDDLSAEEQYQRALQSVVISEAQLLALAEQRANTVKNYLVNEENLAAGRAVTARDKTGSGSADFSGVELLLGN